MKISNKSLTIRKSVPAKRKASSMSIGTIITIIVIGLVIYFVFKNRAGSTAGEYKNLETWDISYDKDGLPIRISIKRDAKRI